MDITLLKQKITEWNKACEYFARPDIKKLLADEEKKAIEFLCDFWKSNEYNPGVCEKYIETLKQCDKLHSSNRDIIEKSKTFRGIAQTFYTKNAEDFDQFRKELGWKPIHKETPTPKNTPTPTPSPTPQHNDALMMINIEKWSKAMQFLRSEIITPQLESNELTAIELLDNMWRRPVYKPDMKEEAAEMVKVLIDSHKLHSSNREIIEHSKNLCGVARKVYENKEIFEAFKKAISQYYKDNQPKRVPNTPIPEKKEKEKKKPEPTPIRKDSELILSDVIFANTDYQGNIIKDYGKTLFNNTQYITPRLIVSSEYYGTETILVKMRYPDGSTSEYDDEITFKGKGSYSIAGWGSNSGTLYADHSYIEYTFICRGKKLWQGRVNITQDPTKAQYPNIIDIKFGATDHDGNIVVSHGSPIPTGIPYLSPMIVVDNNFQGSITLDIEYRFETRNTNKTSSTVNIRGRGEYQLSGWGRSDCDFYTEPETITCTISYKGKKLYSKSVKIGNGSSRKKTPVSRNYNTSSGSWWQRFKNKIEDIGEWFDDKTDNPESVTSIISAIIFIIYVIGIIVYWVNEGFIAALIFGVIGFFVTGLIIMAANFVTKILLYILRFVFLNVWTFLIATMLLLGRLIFPLIIMGTSGLSMLFDTTEPIEPTPETITYYCTAERGVNVRIAPSTSATQVGALTYNQQVDVYDIEGDFARINYNGEEAYVSSKYISIDNNAFLWNLRQQGIGVKILGDGIYYKILKKGKGDKPQPNNTVRCTYELSLPDGTIIDSTGDNTVEFKLDGVTQGLSIALQDMKKGERRCVYIPPEFAYGNKQVGNIPANSILIYDIKLVEILEEVEIANSQLLFTDFTVKQDDGTEASLSDYVGRGRYVLVDFWASWCGPCRKSLPHIINFYRGNNRAVDMLGVAIQDKPENSRAIIEQYDIEYPQILNAEWTHANLYDIEGIPHLILFDPEGRKIMEGYPNDDFFMDVKSIIYKN